MTKAELIEKIARSRDLPPEMTKKNIGLVLDLAFSELATYFNKGRVTRNSNPRFTFPGFGTFTKKKRSARKGVNPRTLEPIEIEACFTLDFKPAAVLKRAMNEPKSGGAKVTSNRSAGAKPGASRRAAGGKGRARRPLLTREQAELEMIPGAELADPPARAAAGTSASLPDAPMRRAATGANGTTKPGKGGRRTG